MCLINNYNEICFTNILNDLFIRQIFKILIILLL